MRAALQPLHLHALTIAAREALLLLTHQLVLTIQAAPEAAVPFQAEAVHPVAAVAVAVHLEAEEEDNT